jgi:hypothetical protein
MQEKGFWCMIRCFSATPDSGFVRVLLSSALHLDDTTPPVITPPATPQLAHPSSITSGPDPDHSGMAGYFLITVSVPAESNPDDDPQSVMVLANSNPLTTNYIGQLFTAIKTIDIGSLPNSFIFPIHLYPGQSYYFAGVTINRVDVGPLSNQIHLSA